MEPTIKITLKLGEPMAVEVSGVRGNSCQSLTKPLEKLGSVAILALKPEYFSQTVSSTQTITQSL
ncbi:MAG: DUF2997 domain-containing protein [Oculatellaceae cyanobacterium Prado106]|jgi:hypothetical protein|nr:DUF2997 domain-containing protein [Oculatellaceae cyanobacterium Prado106]